MAISPKLLNEGERVVVSTRTHVKALFRPLLVLLVVVAVVTFVGLSVDDWIEGDLGRTIVGFVVGGLAAIAVVGWVVAPFLRWSTTTYTFTNRRLIHRTGVFTKRGRTIPLNRISGVDFEIGVVDRLFGCGTLVVSDASEQGRIELHDIPRVEETQRKVSDELHRLGEPERRADDGA